MPDDLKPCPCCGGEAKMEQYRDDGLRIQCRTCALKREQRWLRYGRDWLEKKMIAAWNRRALPAPAAGEPEVPEPRLWVGSDFLADPINAHDDSMMAFQRREDVHKLDGEPAPLYAADQLLAYGDARAEHARRVAPGYALVPVQPTRAMWTAGSVHCSHEDDGDAHTANGRAIAAWIDMVAAAPQQGETR